MQVEIFQNDQWHAGNFLGLLMWFPLRIDGRDLGRSPVVGEDRPQRRRLRITLGVSMALVACLTLPLAWVANHARTQGLALSAISHAGGFVIYGFQRSPDGIILVANTPDPAPDWLRRYVPERYYRDFNVVSLRGARWTTPRSGRSKVWGKSRNSTSTTQDHGCRAGPPAGSQASEVPRSDRDSGHGRRAGPPGGLAGAV